MIKPLIDRRKKSLHLNLLLGLITWLQMIPYASGNDLNKVREFFETGPVLQLALLERAASRIDWREPSAPRLLFDIVVDSYLLKDLPPDISAHARTAIANRDIYYEKAEGLRWRGAVDIYAQVDMTTGRCIGVFPSELRGTIAEYHMIAHEVDHIVVGKLIEAKVSQSIFQGLNSRALSHSYYRYLIEKRAILSEWLYLHLVDRQYLNRFRDDLATRVFPIDFKERTLRFLENSSLSYAEYIRLDEENGRYSARKYNSSFEQDRELLVEHDFIERSHPVITCSKTFESPLIKGINSVRGP